MRRSDGLHARGFRDRDRFDRVLDCIFQLNWEHHALTTVCYMLLNRVNDSCDDLAGWLHLCDAGRQSSTQEIQPHIAGP
jgi:hypothetical protein